MAKSKRLEKLIKEMESHDYAFDDLESYETWLHFFGPYCTSISFESINELEEWLRGVVWD